ncbi:MAG TPA: TetR/AcrR family transcriptional regulator [Solirubrobacterales bacterium]|nr:TetR/AcrR family transcriptional regulator [Solirubrobacterales bacterium]
MATVERAALRQNRERDLIAATRALFDERGVQDAPIEEIAKSVGIARGLIYRQFSSKEELYVATVADYLSELASELDAAEVEAGPDPVTRLERMAHAYAEFCQRYPAFLDSSLAIMRRPAGELNAIISEAIWLRLGRSMVDCIDHVARILHAGVDSGVFEIEDPDFTANMLWTQMLGAMHLARIRVGMKRTESGQPELFKVEADQVVRACVESALATVRASE